MYSCSVLSRYENQITILSDYLEEFPETDEPVWILGRQHHLNTGIFRIKLSVTSVEYSSIHMQQQLPISLCSLNVS